MEIKTKFNVGDKVWVMHNNRPKEIQVGAIKIKVVGLIDENDILSGDCQILIGYVEKVSKYIQVKDEDRILHDERNCFSSKKKLLDSFLNDDE